MGKYGEEGDRLIFKILNSGDYLAKTDPKFLAEKNSLKLTSQISEKALRYDLTVPFSRYVVQHQNEITFPFKRYQVQPVWRADRPQKGRFREFFQCDADVVGSKSLWQEVAFIQLYDTVFTKLSLVGTTIKINNRKILSGIAAVIGAQDKLIDFTVALDKLDKIGKEGVVKEMLSKGITEEAIEKVQPLFDFSGTNLENLAALENMLAGSEEGLKGVEELRFVIHSIAALGLATASLEVDVTLARGLNYYTGAIFEVAAPKGVKMGSIGGGGRYDDLTGVFGLKEVSGVGISFGLDRIYLVLEELGLFQAVALPKPKVIFLNFDATTALTNMQAIKKLRENGVNAEFYPDLGESNKAQKRQWKYVSNREIEYVVSKIENDLFVLKHMLSNEQVTCSLSALITKMTSS
jgi:histidyl-tRNA synthetase